MRNFHAVKNPDAISRIDPALLATLRRRAKVNRRKRDFAPPSFEKPVFIVSAPRSGSALLFERLSALPGVWTTGAESHELIEGIRPLHPRAKNYASNVLTEKDCAPEIAETLRRRFAMDMADRDRRRYTDMPGDQRPSKVRLVEKTPKNALRVSFLKAVFPDALFVFLYRNPRQSVASLMEGWISGRFVAYRNLPGRAAPWSFLLIPGWRRLENASLAEIATRQWETANRFIVDSLKTLPKSERLFIRYRDLGRKTEKTIRKISAFAGLETDARAEKILKPPPPLSSSTLSPPAPGKWKKHEKEIMALAPKWSPVDEMIRRGVF
ncbi:Zinc chelation protein SecC (fragment) [Candidatus Desulfarcum epimagneticum]|uniref:Zinc chelation protein SecC n=1 Tax=uncultured Desulfobacteraceae bacterium TaxID=218296 RepID=A0A484HDF5_9BACT